MDVSFTPAEAAPDDVLKIVSVQESKANARVLHSREDALIQMHILAAYRWLDGENGYLNGFCILEREAKLYLPNLLGGEVKIRPILDETSIALEARAADGTYAPVPAGAFGVWKEDGCHHLRALDYRATVARRLADPRALRLTFKVGYPPDRVPITIKQAIMLLAGHFYQNREAAFADPRSGAVSREIVFGVRALTAEFRFLKDHD